MKEGFDKEIDSLLRRRARGPAKSFADGDGAAATTRAPSHLDADELGAFAEGALPAPARVAAASHLADCDECRGVVVALSGAHGGAVESKKHDAATVPSVAASVKPSAVRAWAAWLFSPRGMRLAVPVLALSAVVVVSYVALRSRNAGPLDGARNVGSQVAARKEQANANASATTATTNNAPEGLVAQGPGAQPEGADTAASQTQAPVGRGHGAAGEAHQPESAAVAAHTSAPPPAASAPPTSPEGPVELAKAAPRPVVEESEPPPASKAEDRPREKGGRAAEPADEIAAQDIANQQRRAAQTRGANEMPDGARNQQKRAGDNNASNIYGGATAGSNASRDAERETKDTPLAARRGRAVTRSERRGAEGDDETARAGETRSAAGHRFRRVGNAWVDVNYKTSMSSTGVRRGAESFRALVADHPEVGRIAEQLGGEVIIVIGRRAYRIQ